jgi:hypothetical protein
VIYSLYTPRRRAYFCQNPCTLISSWGNLNGEIGIHRLPDQKENSISLLRSRSRLVLILSILIGLSLAISGCSILGAAPDPVDPDYEYTSQEQALESGDDIERAALVCPKDMTKFALFPAHTWDFSPSRDLELMKINGQTEALSPCPFSVAGSTVIMEECHVPITNTGFIQTDDGPCDITASGMAFVSIRGHLL